MCNVVDHFRQAVLDLPQLSLPSGAGILRESKIPHTYLWSSELLPKPEDWDDTIGMRKPSVGLISDFF